MSQVEVEVVGPLLLTRAAKNLAQAEIIDMLIVVGLNEKGGTRGYLITINNFQANALRHFLSGQVPPTIFRPYVDAAKGLVYLFGALTEKTGCKLDRISVTEHADETVRASIHLNCGENKTEVPTDRAIDAIYVALRLKCGIFMNEDFIREREYVDVSKIAKPQEEIPSIESLNIDWDKVKE